MYDLLAALPADRFARLYGALPPDLSAAFDGVAARVLNCRVGSVRRQPEAMRAKALRVWIVRQRDDAVAGDLLRAYFLGPRRELVTGFLDAAGVAHEEGQVGEDARPDPAKLPAAIEALRAGHDAADVLLYLGIAAKQWPECEPLQAARRELAAAQG